MTKITLKHLIWDEWNREHIKKHAISEQEVIIALENTSAHTRGYANRILLIGRSGKRILVIVLNKERSGQYYVVTARDADKKERRLLYEKERS